MNNLNQSSVPFYPERFELTQAELNKFLADIHSGQLTKEELIKLLMVQNFGELVINAGIRYFKSRLVSFGAVKQPEIETVSNRLKPHVAMLEKLASVPESQEKMKDLVTLIMELAQLQLEINLALHKCGMKHTNTGISFLEQ
ncbi:hypothetical protein [Nostoc sp. 2RC]|uniref:hypothetical protein n=1 Tax=Nostoc sp. 2RC TaxID=2485484 RepID=UPI0016235978|nr:hypothetical protein [Nostoc sp. 2RC]MBC1241699.1 hypothetical protein [Nostoc sp. 2RC]